MVEHSTGPGYLNGTLWADFQKALTDRLTKPVTLSDILCMKHDDL
jgi:hypothetical protein